MLICHRARARTRRLVGHVTTGLALALLAGACVTPGLPQLQPPSSAPPAPPAPQVTTTDLPDFRVTDDLPVVDINNHGQVVGVRYVEGEYRTTFWDDGAITDLGLYEARSCFPPEVPGLCGGPQVFINDRRQVGTDIDGHAVLWQEGRFVDVDGDAMASQLLDLNERGEALMQRFTGEQTILSLWSQGRLQEVPAPPLGFPAVGGRLSDAGHVVVSEWDPSAWDAGRCPFTAYLWRHGQRREIGSLAPTDVNRRGQVIGTACEVVDGTRTFFEALWDGGEMRRLPGLDELAEIVGGNPISALDINDRGQIAGYNVVPGPNPGSVRRETVLWEGGEIAGIGPGTGAHNSPAALNERGQVLIGNPGYVWDDGNLIRLAPADAWWDPNHVYQMNDRGQIVGYRTDEPLGPRIATLWEVELPRP